MFTLCDSVLSMLITFASMSTVKQASIRTKLMVQYSNILVKARKGVNGLRLQHLQPIMLIGDNGEGLRGMDISNLTGAKRNAVHNKYSRMIKTGFVYKSDKKYYLTDSGRQVYNTICREFDASMNEIIAHLVREAVKRAE